MTLRLPHTPPVDKLSSSFAACAQNAGNISFFSSTKYVHASRQHLPRHPRRNLSLPRYFIRCTTRLLGTIVAFPGEVDMKLRIRGNSVRVRLGESEVARLASEGRVEETTPFAAAPGQQLTYVVSASTRLARQISAAIRGQTISIEIPEVLCRTWAASNQVSLHAEQPIEKTEARSPSSWKRTSSAFEPRHDEDESDAFPNPAGRVCNPD